MVLLTAAIYISIAFPPGIGLSICQKNIPTIQTWNTQIKFNFFQDHRESRFESYETRLTTFPERKGQAFAEFTVMLDGFRNLLESESFHVVDEL